jgi:hypothetical protein
LYAFRICPMRATYPSNPLLDMNILNIFCEGYKLLSSPWNNFIQPPVIWSLIGPNVLLSTLFSNALKLFFPLKVRDKFSYPCKKKNVKLQLALRIL